MLQIDYDIKDALITEPGLSMIDPAKSFRPVIHALGETAAYWLPPTASVLMLRPQQLMPGWPAAVKFRAGDYGAPSGWEEQQVRGTDDWWMHSTKSPVTPLSLAYTFPANVGWYIEFRAYALPKVGIVPIFDLLFGQNFHLVVQSDGHVDLYDQRSGTAVPIGSGNIAQRAIFNNADVSLLVLPYRRQRLLIYSPSHGGSTDIAIAVGPTSNITEPCTPTIYSSVSAPAALAAITPLLFAADGVPAIQAPALSLTRALSQTPDLTASVLDSGTPSAPNALATLSILTPYVASPPVTKLVYAVIMAGNTLHQTAAVQGVLGIGPAVDSPPATTGDSVFDRGGYPYSLYTPALYLTVLSYPRTLGPKSYTTNTLTGILEAKLSLSKDRAAKSFTFIVDNPANITGIGANYTSLKDLQNRRVAAYLTNAAAESGASDAAIAADPDADTPLIVANGYKRVVIFDGFSDQPEFVDGVQSQVRVRCQGLRKRLRNYIFPDQPHYDGMAVNDVVTDILTRAGFVGAGDLLSTGMPREIVNESSTTLLPNAVPGDEPLFTPALGSTAEEFLQILVNYTGWVLDDLITVGASNSCWYWTSPGYYAASVYAAQGSPTVHAVSTYTRDLSVGTMPLVDADEPNPGLGSLAMLESPPPRQSLEELIANNIYVMGTDDSGHILLAHARDEASISDRSAVNYVGEERTYILVSQSINTQSSANAVCAILSNHLTQARTHVSFTLPDFYPQLGISAPLTVAGYWNGAIDAMEADLSNLRVRRTHVSVVKTQ